MKRIALGFPGTHERRPFGDPWFNVGSKSFAIFWKDQWVLKLPQAQQMMLFDARPETFREMRAGRMVWSYVDVNNLDTAELRDLLEAAWRMVTPKKIQKDFRPVRATSKRFYSGHPSTRPKQSV